MEIAKYIVTDRATGRELIRGTAQQCAAALSLRGLRLDRPL